MNISISRDGKKIGEWSEEDVRGFYQEGRLIDTDCFCREGMTEWTPLSHLIRPPPAFPATSPKVSVPNVSEVVHPVAPPPVVRRLVGSPKVSAPNVPADALPVAPSPGTMLPLPGAILDQQTYSGLGRRSFLGIVLAITFGGACLSAL